MRTSEVGGPLDPWLETGQVALLMCRSMDYVRRLYANGLLPSQKRRGRWVVRRSVLVAFLSDNLQLIGPYRNGPYGHQEGVSGASSTSLE